MTYIWNRAERVPASKMPNALIECFSSWEKDKLSEITEKTSECRKDQILYTIKRQKENFSDAMLKFNRKDKV